MITVSNVSKAFGAVKAVDGVSFTANDGVITALLGPNGAGKTTTMRMVTGLLVPDAGAVTLDGTDIGLHPREGKRLFGALSHGQGTYVRLTGREHLHFAGALQNMDVGVIDGRIAALAPQLGLEELLDRRTEGFSQGQKLRLALARALLHDPQNVVLDEPTAGLDVKGTRAVRTILDGLRKAGKCVVLSTHVMQEVAALADQIVVIGRGRVQASGSADELRAETGKADLEEAFLHVLGDAEGLQ
jgi:sodium transport system ATP-binding protein